MASDDGGSRERERYCAAFVPRRWDCDQSFAELEKSRRFSNAFYAVAFLSGEGSKT